MPPEPSSSAPSSRNENPSERLDSWKDVAAYLRRDVRTVQRWERHEGLPVHRHFHHSLGSVYAFRHELDAWLKRRNQQASVEAETAPKLRRVSAVAGLMVVVLAAFTLGLARGRVASPQPDITSLVVLPFENLSDNPSHAYLATGLTEELTARLAQLRALRVVSRTSAISVQGRRVSLPAIGRALQVDAVLQGTVRHHDGRVTISLRLVHAPTDTHLWGGEFERDATDLLALQRDVARAVADEVRVQLSHEEWARLATLPMVNPKAHEEYLLGRHLLWKFIEEDRLRAIEHFHRAISIAPDYAPPYAGLAHAWWMRGVFGPLTLAEVAAPARDAAYAALARDERLAEAHAALAYVEGMFDWEWASAEARIQRAIQLQPNSVDARYVYSILLMAMGRLPAALSQIEQAAGLDPLSGQVQSTFGRILYRARRYDEAVARLNRAIELEPRNAGTHARLAMVYEHMGRHDEAIQVFAKARALMANPAAFQSRVARIYAQMGRASEARRLLAQYPKAADTAAVRVALGDRDAAFTSLAHSIDAREDWPLFIKADPDFDSLRADPRWPALLQRMGLGTD